MDKRWIVLDAVETLKKSEYNATAIKVELEGQLDRNEYNEDQSESACLEYIMKQLIPDYDDPESDVIINPSKQISYAQFYNDGSVDSELTITVRLDDPQNIFLLPKIIDAWNKLVDKIGNGCSVEGAGMHMALLNNRECSYPVDNRNSDQVRFQNFKKSMTLLLPALFFLATPNKISRALEYRKPQVASSGQSHGSSKFDAIHYKDGAVEFRVFDTCYKEPSTILDNVVVMKNCMRYWRTSYLDPKLAKVANNIYFGNEKNYTLERFYTSVKHIEILNAGLRRLKPCYYTIKELKTQRDFKISKNTFRFLEKRLIREAQNDYPEYNERFNWRLIALRHHIVADEIEYRGTRNELEATRAADEKVERVRIREKQSLSQYVQAKIQNYEEHNNRNDYILMVN